MTSAFASRKRQRRPKFRAYGGPVWKCTVLIVELYVVASGYNYFIAKAQYSWLKVLLSEEDFSVFYSPGAYQHKEISGFTVIFYLKEMLIK